MQRNIMSFGQDPSYFAARGATATARAIAQQGACWQQLPALLLQLPVKMTLHELVKLKTQQKCRSLRLK